MNQYSAEAVMAGLKDFQRETVGHVIERFFGPSPTRRFLVADETGLGKSVVARGVIAKLVERLQDDPDVGRIDVIYVCSNQDIAAQNLARLKVTPGEAVALSSRLTLLAKHSAKLEAATVDGAKAVNLVAFTPGTSFDTGWRTGKAEERAMLFLLLEEICAWDGWQRHAAIRALQGTVGTPARFEDRVERLRRELNGPVDRRIFADFRRVAREQRLIRAFSSLLEDIGRRRTLPADLKERSSRLTGKLRTALAQAGVETLEPDLVILDEFQRFRHLLAVDEGNQSAELAQHLFNHGDAKVMLLSATPYKPYTLAEESAAGDDHYRDFWRTLSFLCDEPAWNAEVSARFTGYREAMERGARIDEHKVELERLLLRVMSRTERPALGQDGMLRERLMTAADIRADDVRAYIDMRRVAQEVNAPVSIEYWKSAPFFLNFTEGYKLGHELRRALSTDGDGTVRRLIERSQLLDVRALRSFKPVELGNARLRNLVADTLDDGWWRLLWVPPSMPHYRLAEPFATLAAKGMTKRLLFSSWIATPTAVAGLMSYEAERRIAGGRLRRNDAASRRRVAARFEYRLDAGRPAGMSTLALFWPHPRLALMCDPLTAARENADQVWRLEDIERNLQARLLERDPADLRDDTDVGEAAAWEAAMRWPGAGLPRGLDRDDAVMALSGQREDDDGDLAGGLEAHVALALDVIDRAPRAAAHDPAPVVVDLASIGMHGPGNVAWRAIDRLRTDDWLVTEAGHWRAAAELGDAFRTLFNRIESILLIDSLDLDPVYWRAVLKYCAAGGLQAVMDEYLHHLRSAMSDLPLDDESLLELTRAAGDALTVRPSTYRAFDPLDPDTPIPLLSRFALRYGGRRDDAESSRQPEVRNAFNSPFWPFVLATTSAGQEGIDFHWWCSAIVHWNTPANPVDFEQREGRVHRFGGHAIRRNVAAQHRAEALRSGANDVWAAAYEAARRKSGELGDFAPYWVYPGEAKVERHLMPYAMSRDIPKVAQLKDDLVMYRLAFGQPRQEDLLALLRRTGDVADDRAADALDLRPRARSAPRATGDTPPSAHNE